MNKEQTGLAAEFWFFSQLHRLGYKSYITLGNTKKIDIAVSLEDGRMLTFDVKGKINFVGSFQYLDNVDREKDNHFIVFVNLAARRDKSSKKTQLLERPNCYIIRSDHINEIAFDWNPGGKGFGFEAKLLWYLKDRNEDSITEKNITDFKRRHSIAGELNFAKYESLILNLQDFEDIFYKLK